MSEDRSLLHLALQKGLQVAIKRLECVSIYLQGGLGRITLESPN
jgi:hypothetical protein